MVNDIEAAKRAIKRALADPAEAARVLGLDPTFTNREKREKPRPGTALVRCVFHADRNPSMSLTRGPEGTVRAHCFTCDRAWDVFAVYAAREGREGATGRAWIEGVLEPLARLAGVSLDTGEGTESEHDAYARAARQAEEKERREAERWAAPDPYSPADQALGALAAVVLHLGRLDGGPLTRDVCAYLEGRGLLDVARAEGWGALPPPDSAAARTWARMLRDVAGDIAHDLAGSTGLSRGRCARIVARELRRLIERDRARGHRRPFVFRAAAWRLVIPFRAPCGKVYTFQRRYVGARDPGNKYLFPRDRGARWPYGIERLASAPADAPIAYCEGALDVEALRRLDIGAGRVVLGIAGGDWKPWYATLARGRTAIIATDADAPDRRGVRAGDRFAAAWAVDLLDAGALAPIKRLRPGEGSKDWGEVLSKMERAA